MPRYSIAQPQFWRGEETSPPYGMSRTVWFNLDNGAGATVDDVVLRAAVPIVITGARILYVDATAGTVAGGNVRVGTTVGGAQIVAATAYVNASTVGSETPMTIVDGNVPANTPVIVRHTGVAAGPAGQAVVEIEYRES